MRCRKCHQAPPAEGDSWCISCSAAEALTRQLASQWPSAGARTLAEDLCLSTVRQIRFLRNLTQGIHSNQQAASQAASKRAREGEEVRPERPELVRKRSSAPSTTHPSTAAKSKPAREPKEEELEEVFEEETEEEEESESEAKDPRPRPAGSRSRRPPEPPGPPPPLQSKGGSGHRSSRGETKTQDRRRRDHRTRHSNKPRHRAGRKHQRLGRLEDQPHVKVHRKLSPVVLDTLSADKGRDSLHRLP